MKRHHLFSALIIPIGMTRHRGGSVDGKWREELKDFLLYLEVQIRRIRVVAPAIKHGPELATVVSLGSRDQIHVNCSKRHQAENVPNN